jgi:hypothetical protein
MDHLEELYENFIDQIINDYPLTTNRLSDYDEAIHINQQIINRISNIRRYLTGIGNINDDINDDVNNNINDDINNDINDDINNNINNYREEYINNYREEYINNYREEYINNYSEEYIDRYGIENIVTSSFISTLDAPLYNQSNVIDIEYINSVRLQENATIEVSENNNHIINALFNYVVNTTFSDFTYTELNELDDVKITLTKEQFDTFEKKDLLQIENTTNCSICMEDYTNDKKVVLLKCNHYYHESCIQNWLCNEKVTCPICRKDTREMLEK